MDMDVDQDEQTVALHSVQLYATKVQTEYPTNEPVTTELKIGGARVEGFECYTADSYSILTWETYDRLRTCHMGIFLS